MKRIRLAGVAGASAVLYTAGTAAFLLVVDLGSVDVLPLMAEHQTRTVIAGWIFVALPVFLAVAGLGFLEAFRPAGSMMWAAALAFIGGGFLVLVRNAIWLAMAYALAPAYANGTEGVQSALAAVGNTLLAFGFVIGDIVGGFLTGGVGVLLFSAGMLRSRLGPRWVAWLGFVVALGSGLALLIPLAEVFAIGNVIALPDFMIWMVAAGITVWRSPESVNT